MNIIKVKNITKTYLIEDQKIQALNNLSLSIKKGDFIAIVGSSGSGKINTNEYPWLS